TCARVRSAPVSRQNATAWRSRRSPLRRSPSGRGCCETGAPVPPSSTSARGGCNARAAHGGDAVGLARSMHCLTRHGRPPMSMKIVEADCINCAACEPECPNTAISNTGTTFVVDAALCTECVGAYDTPSCVDVCPTSCILVDPAEPREVLLE